MVLDHEAFTQAVRALREEGARFLTLEVVSGAEGEVELAYCFGVGEEARLLSTRTLERTVPSLFSFFRAADFPEREAARAFGVKFLGHPNLPLAGEER